MLRNFWDQVIMIRVNVNRHVINRNRNTGSDDPPFTIYRPGKRVERASEVSLEGNVRLIYRPEKPLKCGATVWLEADQVQAVTKSSETI